MFAKFYEIPSMILQDIKETKRYGHTDGRSVGRSVVRSFGRSVGRTDVRTDGQREKNILTHKHSFRGV